MKDTIKSIQERNIFQEKDEYSLKQINYIKALETDISIDSKNANNFYIQTGLKHILEKLLTIQDDLDLIFVENPTIATTLESGILKGVSAIWGNTAIEQFSVNISKTFPQIIDSLKKRRKLVFWHPSFFIEPSNGRYFISEFSEYDTDDLFIDVVADVDKNINELSNFKQYYSISNHNNIKVFSFDLVDSEYNKILDNSKLMNDDLINLHLLNHKLYSKYFLPKELSNQKSIFISLPIVASPYGDSHYDKDESQFLHGQSALFIFLSLKNNYNSQIVHSFLNEFIPSVANFVKEVTYNFVFREGYNLYLKEKQATLNSTISNIINRNTAHHLISHVSPRTTIDEILKRLGFKNAKELQADSENNKHQFFDFDSIFEMQNRYLKYVSDREEYVAGLDNNTQPVKLSFYKDIIMPFIENCLFIDNIAASEGISFTNSTVNKEVVSSQGVSKLRIRVFYKDNIFKAKKDKKNLCAKEIHHFECSEDCKIKTTRHELEYNDLALEGYTEMVAHYQGIEFLEIDQIKKKDCCIHELPFYRKLNETGSFYSGDGIEFTCDDIEILARGTQSAHIVYSMLENHIRNTAKHSPREIIEKAEHVDIILKVSPKENENYSYNLEITTNIPTFSSVVDTEEEAGLKENESNYFAKLFRNSKADIDESTSSLGLADMRINSNFLRFGEITQGNLKTSLQLGYTTKQNTEGLYTEPNNPEKKYKYAIKFSCELLKPRTIAFIGFAAIAKKDKERLESGGCGFFSDFDKETSKFTFNIIHSKVINESKDFLKEWIYKIPRRSFIIANEAHIKDIDLFPNRFKIMSELPDMNSTENDLLEWCWKNWLKKWTGVSKEIFLTVIPDELTRQNIYNTQTDVFKSDYTSKFNIDFSRHSANLRAHYENKAMYNSPDWFHESLEKNNKDFDFIWGVYKNGDYFKNFVHYDLAETGLLKILVLDERITELCNYSGFDNPPNTLAKYVTGIKKDTLKFIEAATTANVFIATSINGKSIKNYNYSLNYDFEFSKSGIKLNSNNPIDNRQYSKSESKNVDLLDNFNFDVLIIHRTFLEEIIKNTENTGLFQELRKRFPMIYISTGGGNISNVEKESNTSFNLIALHSLKKYLNRIVMKHSLKQILT